ncbi:hypothetical protein T492DRAFT_1020086, partial [Pavlovales sp. CCMP2436]
PSIPPIPSTVPRVTPVRTPSDTRTPRLDARIGPGGPMHDVGERQTPRRPHASRQATCPCVPASCAPDVH